MDLQLAGKRAIVTGGSSGLGRAAAEVLVAEGADVALVARDVERLKRVADELRPMGPGRVTTAVADTSDEAAVEAMVATVVDELGGVEILVNSAARVGGVGARGVAGADPAVLSLDMDVKLFGYLRCVRAVVPHMTAAGWGRIINVGGVAARSTGSIGNSVRNSAVQAMSKNLADELGPRGINVTVVHPSRTRTPERDGDRAISGSWDNSIGRIVDSSEVAWVIAFLASPRSVAITGEAIVVGGGMPGPIFP